MPIAVILVLAALVFYTAAIFSEKFKKKLEGWIITVFILGFLSDLMGTMIMGVASGKIIVSVHAFFGGLALIIMALHLSWAILAFRRKGRAEKLFQKYSLCAWLVWLAAFFSGLPKSG